MSYPSLTGTVFERLRLGPATAFSLARWCELRLCLMEPILEGLRRARRICKVGTRYMLPFTRIYPRIRNIAPPVRIGRGSRWAAGLYFEIGGHKVTA